MRTKLLPLAIITLFVISHPSVFVYPNSDDETDIDTDSECHTYSSTGSYEKYRRREKKRKKQEEWQKKHFVRCCLNGHLKDAQTALNQSPCPREWVKLTDYDNRYETPLHYAIISLYNKKNILNTFASEHTIRIKSIFETMTTDHLEFIKKLLYLGAPATQPDLDGNTAIHLAARYGFYTIFQALIQTVSNLDLKGSGGNTPLHEAAYQGHYKIIKQLLLKNANPWIMNKQNQSPIATTRHHHTKSRKLLEHAMSLIE